MFYIICSIIISLIVVFSIFSNKYKNPFKLYFIFGKKGSGKSCLMIKKLLEYKKMGWTCYTDMPVNIPGVRIISSSDLKNHWPDENSALFLDEVGLTWDNRGFKTFDKGFTEFFKLQRKCKCVVYMNSQSFDIDKKIRDVTDSMILQSNIGNIISISRPIVRSVTLTDATGDQESRIADQLEFAKFWHWKFYLMPRYFKYFYSFDKPFRPSLPYKVVPETEVVVDRHKHIFFRRKKICPSGSGAQPPESSPVSSSVGISNCLTDEVAFDLYGSIDNIPDVERPDHFTTTKGSVTEDGRKNSTFPVDIQPQL